MPTIRPLRFYQAQANKQFTLNDCVVQVDQIVFIAKWKGLYVLATNSNNFFVTSPEKAAEYARTMRLSGRKLLLATNAPVIRPVGPQFEWHVEAGSTDEDNCDETTTFSQLVTDKEEAEALVTTLKTTRFTNHLRDFLRIRGPMFYSFQRPPVPPPPPPRPRRITPVESYSDRLRAENMRRERDRNLGLHGGDYTINSRLSYPMYASMSEDDIDEPEYHRASLRNTEAMYQELREEAAAEARRRADYNIVSDVAINSMLPHPAVTPQGVRETITQALNRLNSVVAQDRQRRATPSASSIAESFGWGEPIPGTMRVTNRGPGPSRNGT